MKTKQIRLKKARLRVLPVPTPETLPKDSIEHNMKTAGHLFSSTWDLSASLEKILAVLVSL